MKLQMWPIDGVSYHDAVNKAWDKWMGLDSNTRLPLTKLRRSPPTDDEQPPDPRLPDIEVDAYRVTLGAGGW